MAKKQKFVPLDVSLNFQELEDLDNLLKDEDFLGNLYEGVTLAIKELGNKKTPKITIITLSNMDLMINLSKNNYKKVIDKALEYYTIKENYNKCIELTKLKSKL